MSGPVAVACFIGVILLAVVALLGRAIRRRNAHLWLGPYLYSSVTEPVPTFDLKPIDVFIAVCDHFEPEWGQAPPDTARRRVRRWVDEYPKLAAQFRDASGRSPRHTFFFPADQYQPEYLDLLAGLCESGCGDVEVHLHHHDNLACRLQERLERFRETLFHRHGLLRRDPITGRIVYGFIHGNWALCNSRPDGQWCGVNDEIPVLLRTGCYADFTLPSAPMPTQTRTINRIYYAEDRPGRAKSHDTGIRARVGCTPPADSLLMIQGPLVPDWQSRKFGVVPRIENGDLRAGRPPDWRRFQRWLQAGVCVAGRPEWRFVKLHTHGAKPGNDDMLLGPPMHAFHATLARMSRTNPSFRYHYVSAWEMAQLVHRAERGEALEIEGLPLELAGRL